MTIITKTGSYRTVDGRQVMIEWRGGNIAEALNLELMSSDGSQRVRHSHQKFYLDGCVVWPRPGEENDRIVGEWIELPATSPVIEVVTKVVKPGTYGIIEVTSEETNSGIGVAIDGTRYYDAVHLRAAAKTLLELADFVG